MTKRGEKKKRAIIVSAIAVLFVAAVTIVFLIGFGKKDNDPYVSQDATKQEASSSSTDTTDIGDDTAADSQDTTLDNTGNSDASADTVIDPQSVATITIAPMNLIVSYIKGVGGFEYEVLRTVNGTRYVELRNADLIGTKCTNDLGAFASILESPGSTEASTLTKTTKVGDTTYGLSLPDATCTGNADKLKVYQKSFSDAFSLLKKSS